MRLTNGPGRDMGDLGGGCVAGQLSLVTRQSTTEDPGSSLEGMEGHLSATT